MQFKDIVGQRDLINRMTEIIDSGRISHAQLLLGKNGYGAFPLALAYAQYLNCEHRQHYAEGSDLRADSCGTCPSCLKYQQLMHTDLHLYFPTTTNGRITSNPSSSDYQEDFRKFVLDNKGYISINDWYAYAGAENKQGAIYVRDANAMVDSLALKANEGGYKVVIVWMVEKMRTDAANKLLKTFEEPYPKTLILLVCEDGDQLLSTIVSRTQMMRVPQIDKASLTAHLAKQCGQSPDPNMVDAAMGDLLAANRYLTQHDQDTQFAEQFVVWMRQLFKLSMANLSQWVDQMSGLGREQQKRFLAFSSDAIRACFLKSQAGLAMEYQLQFGDEKFNMSFPYMITANNIEALTQCLDEATYAIERNANPKITFMELSFRISKALKKR